jgi:hypothetical protein
MNGRSRTSWQSLGRKVLTPVLLAGIAVGSLAAVTAAQDATPAATPPEDVVASRPGHIHTGTCDEVGEVVGPLENLTAPVGDTVGQASAMVAQTSFTNVPLTLDQVLAEDHVVNLHLSDEEIAVYIACGEIGGVLDANGALVIGLGETDGSGFSGIAYLAPGADGASIDVSVFLVEDSE